MRLEIIQHKWQIISLYLQLHELTMRDQPTESTTGISDTMRNLLVNPHPQTEYSLVRPMYANKSNEVTCQIDIYTPHGVSCKKSQIKH